MPRTTLPINDTQIKNAKPKDKNYKLIDGQGLYLLVKQTAQSFGDLTINLTAKSKLTP